MQVNGTVVQDWTQIYGRDCQRRYVSNAERIKLQKKKKKLARKRRRRRAVLVGSLVLFFMLMLIMGIVTVGKYFLSGLNLYSIDNKPFSGKMSETEQEEKERDIEENGYGIRTPYRYEGKEIYSRLKELSELYPEFEEIYENADAYPESILAVVCSNLEMIDYVKGYPKADGSVTGGLSKDELSGGIPLLIQWDKRWGYAPYGDDNIGLSGCAPVCLSMVIVGLTGDSTATPDRIADYAMENNHYVMGTGTAWSLMTEGGAPYGVFAQQMGLDKEAIFSTLEGGTPIICSMGEGDFTTSGHFIVLTGIEDGKIRVNDPNSRARSKQLWDYDTLSYQIRNLWAYYRY